MPIHRVVERVIGAWLGLSGLAYVRSAAVMISVSFGDVAHTFDASKSLALAAAIHIVICVAAGVSLIVGNRFRFVVAYIAIGFAQLSGFSSLLVPSFLKVSTAIEFWALFGGVQLLVIAALASCQIQACRESSSNGTEVGLSRTQEP